MSSGKTPTRCAVLDMLGEGAELSGDENIAGLGVGHTQAGEHVADAVAGLAGDHDDGLALDVVLSGEAAQFAVQVKLYHRASGRGISAIVP